MIFPLLLLQGRGGALTLWRVRSSRQLQVIVGAVVGSVSVIGAAAWVWFRRAAKRDQIDLGESDASGGSSYERLAQ